VSRKLYSDIHIHSLADIDNVGSTAIISQLFSVFLKTAYMFLCAGIFADCAVTCSHKVPASNIVFPITDGAVYLAYIMLEFRKSHSNNCSAHMPVPTSSILSVANSWKYWKSSGI